MKESAIRETIVRLAQSLFQRGYTVGSSGNISARVDDGMLMTPTNSCFGFLDPARLSKLDNSGKLVSGDAPSKEIFLHNAFYETRKGTGAVVHLHSTHATAVSCLPDINPDDCIPPLTPYVVMRVGRVKLVPYVRPGNPAMGELVRALDGKYAAVLLANHGPVVSAKDVETAVYASEELEETAKLVLLLRGKNPRRLTDEQIEDLIRVFQAPKP
jgi:ribulose-5-phosphate 4-epimerase/fuculose-1-phosphate aldolase